jgi:hypothetical protein
VTKKPYSLHAWARANSFKTALEETYFFEQDRDTQRPWFEQIPTACGGFIGVFRLNPPVVLQYFTSKARPTAKKLLAALDGHPEVRHDFHSDGSEATVYFPAALLTPELANLIRARKRRVLSPEHKTKLAEAGKATRFNPGLHGSKDRQNPQNEAIPTQARG